MHNAHLLPQARSRNVHASPDATIQIRSAPSQQARCQRLQVPRIPAALPSPCLRMCGLRHPGHTLNTCSLPAYRARHVSLAFCATSAHRSVYTHARLYCRFSPHITSTVSAPSHTYKYSPSPPNELTHPSRPSNSPPCLLEPPPTPTTLP